MILLALDSATLAASVAVVEGAPQGSAPQVRVLGVAAARVTTHSEGLLGLVAESLTQAGLGVAQVDVFGCGAGPGSFTGLRIGLSTVKGLAFASQRPLVLASSLRALALGAATAATADVVGAVLDARKGEVYGGFYHGATATPLGDEVALPPADFAGLVARRAATAPVLLCGTGVVAYPEELGALAGVRRGTTVTPGAVEVGRLCLERLGAEGPADLATASPSYVRPSEAEVKSGLLDSLSGRALPSDR